MRGGIKVPKMSESTLFFYLYECFTTLMVHYVVFANMPFLSFWISFPEPYSAALTRDITYQMFNLNSGCFHITAGPKRFGINPLLSLGRHRNEGGLRGEVLVMLFKMLVKERERGEGGLMKYLRFSLKRNSEKVCNKGVCRGPPLSRGPGGSRGQVATDMRRAHIEPGCVGSAHSCVAALPPQPPAPCLCQPLWGPQSGDFTPRWLHSNGFVSPTRRPRPSMTIGAHSLCIVNTHILPSPISLHWNSAS